MDAKTLQRAAALMIAFIAVALHWPPATTDFNVDDHGFIVENESLRDMGAATQALIRSFPPAENGRGLYRPLTNFSHALEWPYFELDSRGYHCVNALLYGVICALVFALLRWFRLGLPASVAAAALFAVHPVHTEAVDAIAGRSELLALGFSLVALLAFARALIPAESSEPRTALHGGWFTLATLALVAALGSKETGVLTAALMLVQLGVAHLAAPGRLTWRRALGDALPIVLVLFSWALLRTSVLGRFSPVLDTRMFEFASSSERLFTMASIYLEYLRLIVWPHVLQPDFYYVETLGIAKSLDARVASGGALALLSIAACAGAALALVRSSRRAPLDPRSPQVAGTLGGLAFLAYLLPVSHIVDVGALMAERFLFAPSLGLALLAGALLSRAFGTAASPKPGRAFAAVAGLAIVALCAAGAVRSSSRAAEWRSAHALWSSYALAAPGDARGWSSLGAIQIDRRELVLARQSIERALEIEPGGYPQQINRASLLVSEQRYGDAIDAYQAMLDSWPRVDQRVWIGLARLHAREGRLDEARRDAVRALEIHPNFAETHRLIEQIDSSIAERGAASH